MRIYSRWLSALLIAWIVPVVAYCDDNPEIKIFASRQQVPANCLYLGRIGVSVEGDERWQLNPRPFVMSKLRARATEVGGDALVTGDFSESRQTINRIQRLTTTGAADVFRCSGSWLTGSLPPLVLPILTAALEDGDVVLPRPQRTQGGRDPIETLGEFRLGMKYSNVKSALNSHEIAIKQAGGGSFDPFQAEVGSAYLMPLDDPRGRRWMFVPAHSPVDLLPQQSTTLALGFDQQQSLITIAVLSLAKEGEIRVDHLASELIESLDARYARASLPKGVQPSSGTFWTSDSSPGRVVGVFATKAPAAALFLVYTIDPAQLVYGTPPSRKGENLSPGGGEPR